MVKEKFRKSWSTTSRRGWVLTRISWHRSGTITEEWERELYGGAVPTTPGVFMRHEGTTVPQTAGQEQNTQQEEEDSSDGAEDQHAMQQDAQPRTQDAQPATEAAQPATGDAASSHTRAAN
eukprot:3137517-Lingulodinium_polyedra.AAC.1